MKKLLTLLCCAFLICGAAYAENKTVTFTVDPPLVCNNCENKVKENIRFEKGVKAVKPSAKKGIVEVTYDDKKTDVGALKEGFKKIGYNASELEPTVCPEAPAPCCSESPAPACCTESPAQGCCNQK